MSDEHWVAKVLRRIGQSEAPSASPDGADLGEIDRRLSLVEQDLSDIAVRLRLLERQADPRGIREGTYDV